jgi:hypothetical protein
MLISRRFLQTVTVASLLLSVQVSAQENVFRQLVGRWDKVGEGKEIIIDPAGSVFAQGDFPLSGSAAACIAGGGNFCFEGRRDGRPWLCAYHIAFLNGGQETDWGLTEGSPAFCPRGPFYRSGR